MPANILSVFEKPHGYSDDLAIDIGSSVSLQIYRKDGYRIFTCEAKGRSSRNKEKEGYVQKMQSLIPIISSDRKTIKGYKNYELLLKDL